MNESTPHDTKASSNWRIVFTHELPLEIKLCLSQDEDLDDQLSFIPDIQVTPLTHSLIIIK